VLLAAVVSVLPGLWVLALVSAVVAVVVTARRGRPLPRLLGRAAVTLIAPLVLLLPWTLWVVANPAALLGQPGLPGPVAPDLSALDIVLLSPGGPGTPIVWVGAGVLVAAVIAVLRPDRRTAVIGLWIAAFVAIIAALIVSHVAVAAPGTSQAQPGWPGGPVLILAIALILAVVLAGDGIRHLMADASFTWRQPVVFVGTVAAFATPVLAALAWLPGAGDPLRRDDPQVLPSFVAAEAIGPQAPRTLVLRPTATGVVDYTLVNGLGPELGDADVAPPAEDWSSIDELVAALVSGRGGAEVVALADYAVRYVVLEADAAGVVDPSVVRTLDSVPGLRRVAGGDAEALWRVAGVTSLVRVEAGGVLTEVPTADAVSADPLVAADLPAGGPAELLIAVTPDAAWRAVVVDGPALEAVEGSDLQRFEVPAGVASGANVVIDVNGGPRSTWLWVQGVALLIVIVLSLPGRRRPVDEDDAEGLAEWETRDHVPGVLPADDDPADDDPEEDDDPAGVDDPADVEKPVDEPGQVDEPVPADEPGQVDDPVPADEPGQFDEPGQVDEPVDVDVDDEADADADADAEPVASPPASAPARAPDRPPIQPGAGHVTLGRSDPEDKP
jgi:hypothetical protein